MSLLDFWRGRRVLITGHTGFKGSWLSLLLGELEAEIAGLALAPPTRPSLYEFAKVEAVLRSVEADIRDPQALPRLVTEFEPEVVLHLAAQSVVATGYAEPVETIDVNTLGTAHVLEAIRDSSVKSVVVVTTDKVYADPDSGHIFSEGDALGSDPYSASKAAAEILTASYRDSFLAKSGVGVATARAGNVLGGGDWTPHQLIPDVIGEFAAGRPAILRYPESVRPWQHVLDALHGYLLLAEALVKEPRRFAGAWNFGPDHDRVQTVGDVTDLLAKTWGSGAHWSRAPSEIPHETAILQINSDKARRELNWRPLLNLEQTVGWICEWYRAYYDGEDQTRAQVARFREAIS